MNTAAKRFIALSIVILASSCYHFDDVDEEERAFDRGFSVAAAVITNSDGEPIGSAELMEEVPGRVVIKLTLSNLQPGVHALHLHSVGRCDKPDFTSAGPHFNPYGKKHGLNNPSGAHAGDLPNITVRSDGTFSDMIFATGVTLRSGTGTLFDSDGTAIVIHERADDNLTDPAGNAGARIACGVIVKQIRESRDSGD